MSEKDFQFLNVGRQAPRTVPVSIRVLGPILPGYQAG